MTRLTPGAFCASDCANARAAVFATVPFKATVPLLLTTLMFDGSKRRSMIKICRTLSAVIPSPSPPPGLTNGLCFAVIALLAGAGVTTRAHTAGAVETAKNSAVNAPIAARRVFITSFLYEVLAKNNKVPGDFIPMQDVNTSELAPYPCLSNSSGRLSGHFPAAAYRRNRSDTSQLAAT